MTSILNIRTLILKSQVKEQDFGSRFISDDKTGDVKPHAPEPAVNTVDPDDERWIKRGADKKAPGGPVLHYDYDTSVEKDDVTFPDPDDARVKKPD